MAIYELVHRYTVYGEANLNRYHFVTPANGVPYVGAAQELAIEWRDFYSIQLDNMLAGGGGVSTTQDIIVTNMYDPTDFGELLGVPFAPLRSGAANPSNWCASIRSPRLQTGWNRGYKRYSGISETDVSGNVPASTWVTVLNGWLTLLCTAHTVTRPPNPDFEVSYRVLRFVPVTDPATGKVHYVKQSTESLQRVASLPVPSMQFYRYASQASRLPGRGA